MSAFGLILLHELATLFKTRRVVALLSVYLGVGALGGLIYVKTLDAMFEAAEEAAVDRGLSQADAEKAIREAATDMRGRVLAFVAGGVEEDEVAESLSASFVLPAFLWSSLMFLPFLVLLTSFDYVSTELSARSLRYSALRASRAELLLGKAAAHLLLFSGLSLLGSLSLVAMAAGLMDDFSLIDNVPGLGRVWLSLLPFAACYLAISTFASTTTTKPIFALLLSFSITAILRMANWFDLVPEESSASALRLISYLSPAHYHAGLWLADLSQPLLSSAVYSVFAAAFMGLSLWMLMERDL